MKNTLLMLICVLPAVSITFAGCIAGNPATRQLQSLTISPASANGSSVQFTATGNWSTAPNTVTPQSATWGACTTGTSVGPTSGVTVSTTGLATCASGATGAYMVFAWDPDYGNTDPTCNVVTACGAGCGRVAATAQITCP